MQPILPGFVTVALRIETRLPRLPPTPVDFFLLRKNTSTCDPNHCPPIGFAAESTASRTVSLRSPEVLHERASPYQT